MLRYWLIILFFAFNGIIVNSAREYHRLPLALGAHGPESVAFDCKGEGPYVGVSDGRILKYEGSKVGWTKFAVTNPYRLAFCDGINDTPVEQICGRPLGLKFDESTCELYVNDASFGLVKIRPNSTVTTTTLATVADRVPFRFLNDLDIDSEKGIIYFTDASSRYHRWEYLLAMLRLDRSGRLMKYDLKTKKVTVLLKGLAFANGVALSKNKDFVLVAETMGYRVQRYWLSGPKAGSSDVFIHLSGRPDNINRNAKGEFWIAQNPTKPILVDETGTILETLNTNAIEDTSHVIEVNNRLWIGSVDKDYILYTT